MEWGGNTACNSVCQYVAVSVTQGFGSEGWLESLPTDQESAGLDQVRFTPDELS